MCLLIKGKDFMNRIKGQNLVEFAIIFGIIVIIGVIALTLLGKQVNQLFVNSTDKAKKFEPFNFSVNNDSNTGNLKAGDLKGTPDNPVRKCNNDVCTIDFGELILTGVPANYNDYIKSNGTSGTTDHFAQLLEEISQQLEDEGKTKEAKIVKDLANMGHFMADYQQLVETKASKCKDDANPYTCFQAQYVYGSKLPVSEISVPDNVKHLIPNFKPNNLATYELERNFFDFDYGSMAFSSESMSQSRPSVAFTSMLKQITSPGSFVVDPSSYPPGYTPPPVAFDTDFNFSDTQKKIIKNLAENIIVMGFDFKDTLSNTSMSKPGAKLSYGVSDPLTGTNMGSRSVDYGTTGDKFFNDMISPQRAAYTDNNSKFICIAGYYSDYSNNCK